MSTESQLNARNQRLCLVSDVITFDLIALIFHVKEKFKGIFLP